MAADVAADGEGGGIDIEAIADRHLESKPGDSSGRITLRVSRERHDADLARVEFGFVLLEVSQLLTAVASPMAAIEEDDGRVALQVVGQLQGSPADQLDLKAREPGTNLQRLHRRS